MRTLTFVFLIILGINSNLFSQDKCEKVESVELWKIKVLKFVQDSLVSFYNLSSDDSRIRLLENYEDFIVKNDNKNYYRIGPSSIFSGDWFEEYGYLKFFPEIIRLDSVSVSFNGFKFFYQVMIMYNSMIEQSEVICEELCQLAYRNPDKFLQFIESINDLTEVQEIVRTPFWTNVGFEEFKKKIEKSKYYDEIVSIILD